MSDTAHTSLTRAQLVDEILQLHDETERQTAEIERLREALRNVRAIVMDDTADPLGSLDTINQALNGQSETPGT